MIWGGPPVIRSDHPCYLAENWYAVCPSGMNVYVTYIGMVRPQASKFQASLADPAMSAVPAALVRMSSDLLTKATATDLGVSLQPLVMDSKGTNFSKAKGGSGVSGCPLTGMPLTSCL